VGVCIIAKVSFVQTSHQTLLHEAVVVHTIVRLVTKRKSGLKYWNIILDLMMSPIPPESLLSKGRTESKFWQELKIPFGRELFLGFFRARTIAARGLSISNFVGSEHFSPKTHTTRVSLFDDSPNRFFTFAAV
jgi:hypothetical protein